MTEHEMNQRIRTAVEHAAPNQLERILSSCDQTEQSTEAPERLMSGAQKKGAVIAMTETRNRKPQKRKSALAAIAAVAAAFVLMFGGYTLAQRNRNPEIDSIIMLDVNPSLTLYVDTEEIVQSVDALNEEARDVLGTMELKGTSLEVSINALIGAMMQKGYLGDLQNSILVSVENKDAARGTQLQQKVSQAISSAMHTDTMDAAVLSQNVDPADTALAELAQTHNISMGKAALIQEVMVLDPTLTFESLVSLSINDIALIASSKQMTSQTVTQTGTASEKAYIGKDEALNIALSHAGVAAADAKRTHVEFDSDDGRMVYEVEFETTDTEYDYDIDATTGEVVKHEVESRYNDRPIHIPNTDNTGNIDNTDNSGNTGNDNSNASSNTGSKPDNSGNSGNNAANAQTLIGEEAAKSAALAHAGVNAGDVVYIHCNLDYDDGITENYDVEFVVGNTEYDYEIHPYTGAILSSDREVRDHDDRDEFPQPASTSYIGESAALTAVLNHASITESDLTQKEIELDEDDGRMVYEVNLEAGRTEYDYEVDALTGEILKSEKEIDD